MITKIISGGQTGTDLGALIGAKAAGIETGGLAPKNWLTENGSNPMLGTEYGLIESNLSDYRSRTIRNIVDSDVTVIICNNTKSPGTKLTINQCVKNHKPYLILDTNQKVVSEIIYETGVFLINISERLGKNLIVNFAGNRESKAPGLQSIVAESVETICKNFNAQER
jgi:hypothetical protein